MIKGKLHNLKDEFDDKFLIKPPKKDMFSWLILVFAAAIYIAMGVFLWNRSLVIESVDDLSTKIVAVVSFAGGLFFVLLFIYSLHYRRSHKQGGFVSWFLFLLMAPFYGGYKRIARSVKETKQDAVIVYFAVTMIAAMISLSCCSLIINRAMSGLIAYLRLSNVITYEFYILVLVCIFNQIFFWLTKFLVYITICIAEKVDRRKESSDLVEKVIEKEWEKAKSQLKISKIFYYVLLVFICISVHPEDDFTRFLISEVLGIVTITALTREWAGMVKEDNTTKEDKPKDVGDK